jgi:phenylpropionate dioxygenase-like ring-hydroxylating dioxygenase large terminal subunit
MELEKNWRKIPRSGVDRFHNNFTQPTKEYALFNNPKVLTEAWYPVLPSKKIRKESAQSFVIGSQRIVIYRNKQGLLAAMDAFCPHMGADLANGRVVGDRLQCYFHQWEFGPDGALVGIPCKKHPPKVKNQAYPVEEKYGFVWVYSGPEAPYPVPNPPGLEGEEVTGFFLAKPRLFVHHHVMMVSAIDLQHFKTVHQLDAEFQFDVQNRNRDQYQWNVVGKLPHKGWRSRIARFVLGSHFEYSALFAGGSIVSINYGNSPHWRGRTNGWKLPSVHILWGCVPQKEGVSDVSIFLVQRKAKSVLQRIQNGFNFALSLFVLTVLRDDDVKAFPHMRFDPKTLIEQDRSAGLLIQLLDKGKKSQWSFEN